MTKTPIPIDAGVFRPEAVSPETKEFNAKLEQMLAAVPPLTSMTPVELRAAIAERGGFAGPIVRVDWGEDRAIAGPAGEIPLRVFVPEVVRGVYLHLHGGGFCLGSQANQDPRLARIATQCEVAVVSVGYRLTPEHPYPACADDCEAAALWLVKNAGAEFGSERLLIGGESAGAHLSVVTLLRLRDRHAFTGFSAANLVYGSYDFSLTPSGARWGDRFLVINTPVLEWFHDLALPSGDRRQASPLYANLSNLPHALFSVGTLDPLLDDSLFMYARWLAGGNDAELAVYPGGVHGFDSLPTDLGREGIARQNAFIASAVAED